MAEFDNNELDSGNSKLSTENKTTVTTPVPLEKNDNDKIIDEIREWVKR